MSEKSNDIDTLLEKIEDFSNQMKKFEKYYKKSDSEIFDELKICKNEIKSLNTEINNYKEDIEKTKEYLLLELETNLDKNKQNQLQTENIYSDLVVFLKNDNTNKLISLSEEIGRYKHDIYDKKELIENLTKENNELNKIIIERDDHIKENTKNIHVLEDNLNNLKISLDKRNDENKNLTNEINQYKLNIEEKNKEFKSLTDEINLFKLNTAEKDKQIKSLKEEIRILNSTIEEQNETLDSFKNGD